MKNFLKNLVVLLMEPERKWHVILWVSCALIAVGFLWAHYAKIDEVTVAQGRVVPSKRVQIIQSLEGGILRKIFVKEGDVVEKESPLVQMDDTQFLSMYREEESKVLFLNAKIARLAAEVNDQPFTPPEELKKEIPDQIASETDQYISRKKELAAMEQERNLLFKEFKITEPLAKDGVISIVETIRLQRALNAQDGRIHNFKSASLNELNRAKSELAQAQENLRGLKDRLVRTMMRSPVKGIVKTIHVNTEGGVIKPGMDIIEVVPLDDTLLIEAFIQPKDVGFLHPGQFVMVKITAYDFYIYGGLPGVLEYIGADTTPKENEESVYKILVRTERNYLGSKEKPLVIIPGMTATVDILTGEKNVLTYLLNPLARAKQQALRER